MVHVVQYDVVGIHEFARRYVIPFIQNRYNYMTIPLETVAFDLQTRFEGAKGAPFSAEAEIRFRLNTPGLPYATRKKRESLE
jgi:hypothetical protein